MSHKSKVGVAPLFINGSLAFENEYMFSGKS